MAQKLKKEAIRTIVKCSKCSSSEVEIRAWVKPNDNNSFSFYYDGSTLENAETCYCRACGQWTKPIFENMEILATPGTNELSTVIKDDISLHNYAEAIADIAFEAGTQHFRPTGNSRDTIGTIIDWADEFTRKHQGVDWNEVEYLDTIWDFTRKKLAAYFHEIEHRCPMCGADTMDLQYADSNPQEISLYCPSCSGFWEDDKAFNILSGVIKWDKEMYGEEARKALALLLKDLDRGQVYNIIKHEKLGICGVYQDGSGKFVAFDNRAGSCFVEEFRRLDTALKWMKGEIEIEERHKYE